MSTNLKPEQYISAIGIATSHLSWASTMFSYNSCPPDPGLVGGKWREMWLERLKGSGLWLEKWLRHQRRDDYWEHGSVCEDYKAINCPVLGVSGFLQEALRWWDQWLKGIETGIMQEPMLRVWMQDSVPPTTKYTWRPGRWVAENAWPSPEIHPHIYRFHPGELLPENDPVSSQTVTIQSPLSVGLYADKWCSYAAPPDLPHDQREEDGGALIFESPPLIEPLEILGAPVVEIDLASNQPVAMLAIRLSDVAPDDKATRITYGLLNLCHLKSHKEPEALQPGRPYRVRLQLNHIAQRFPAGNRFRISISTSYWPLAWPPPKPVRLSLFLEKSRLLLPVRPPRQSDAELRAFMEPEGAVPVKTTQLEPNKN